MAPRPATVLLPLTILSGVYLLHGLGFTPNGVMPHLKQIIESPTGKWPGTSQPHKRSFTGLKPIDEILLNLNPFFAHLVDGGNPSLSIWCLFFAGQYGVAWGLCVLESLRAGNKGRVISFVSIFGTIMQMVGFAVIFPTYLLIHTLTSPLAKSSPSTKQIYIAPSSLSVFPYVLTLSYVLPTALLAYQTPNMSTRQNLISFWQAFPIWTVLAQKILSTIFSTPQTTPKKVKRNEGSSPAYLAQINRTYTFLLTLAISTHVSALLVTLYPALIRSVLPLATKGIVTSGVSLSSVYLPYAPLLSFRAKDLADGVHVFLWWDCYNSSVAALVWVFTLLKVVPGGVEWSKLLPKLLLWTVLAGPFGAVAMLLWERDVKVLSNVKNDD